jgi:hypothetical protein
MLWIRLISRLVLRLGTFPSSQYILVSTSKIGSLELWNNTCWVKVRAVIKRPILLVYEGEIIVSFVRLGDGIVINRAGSVREVVEWVKG